MSDYDIGAIRAAVAAALEPLVAAGTLVTVSPTGVASPEPPMAMVTKGQTKYDLAMGGSDSLTLNVSVVISLTEEQQAQETLDSLSARGALSIKALLEADPRLGGAVDDVRVSESTGYQQIDLATGPALVDVWTLEVLTP